LTSPFRYGIVSLPTNEKEIVMKALGSINACGIASIYKGKKLIATCLDTPNNIAAAFVLHPKATTVRTSTSVQNKKAYVDRFVGLDMKYHTQFITVIFN